MTEKHKQDVEKCFEKIKTKATTACTTASNKTIVENAKKDPNKQKYSTLPHLVPVLIVKVKRASIHRKI